MSGNDDDDDDDEVFDLLDWDDALDEMSADEEDGATSGPPSERSLRDHGEARPLYKPAQADETFAKREPISRSVPLTEDDDEDEVASEPTKIAAIPQELINSLVKDPQKHDRPTHRPPSEARPKAAGFARGHPPPVDMDLDELLDGFDDEPVRPSQAKVEGRSGAPIFEARAPSGEGAVSKLAAAGLAAGDDADDLVTSFEPRERAADARLLGLDDDDLDDLHARKSPSRDLLGLDEPDELPKTRVARADGAPGDDEAEPLPKTRVATAADVPEDDGDEALPKTAIATAAQVEAALDFDDETEEDLAETPVPAARPARRAPQLDWPKPHAPMQGIPKPPLGAGGGPRPGLPKPGIARPAGLPPIPRPGIQRPGTFPGAMPPAGGSPEPGAPARARLGDRLRKPRLPFPAAKPEPVETPAAKVDQSGPAPVPAAPDASISEPSSPPAPDIELPPPWEDGLDEVDADLDALLDSTPPPATAPPRSDVDGEPPRAEPSVALPEPDDLADLTADDGEAAVSSDDDEEMLVIASDEPASSEDDWGDEDWEALEAAQAEEQAAREAAAAEPEDRGADAARRSVRSRKVRVESHPMVGDGAEALRLRKRLLRCLAEERKGELRARIQVAAAEIAEQLGESDEARELYDLALVADPGHVVALRALRRDAVKRQDWEALARLFSREAALDLSAQERAAAWTGLAELHLARRNDAVAAEMAAKKALQIAPTSMAATLLLAEARWHLKKRDPLEAFPAAREIWDDPDARAALAIEEARTAESAGHAEKARELFAWANEVDPEALDGWFGRARTSSRKETDPQGAVEALATIAAYCGSGALGEAILTRASRVATRLLGDPALGVRLLAEATGVVPLQARADAAAATGERDLTNRCIEAWAAAAGGTDRALALVSLAESRAAQGDLDGAESALRDAALADGSLGTIRVVREVIARRSGDVSRLADAVESGGSLAAAARVASDEASLARERNLLDEAIEEGTKLVTADVLSLDVAAAQGDPHGVDAALRRQADRVPPEQRIGSLLAMTDRAIDRDDLDGAEALLAEARLIAPGDPVVLRPLGRLAFRRDPAEAAALWLEEASGSSGTRAAHAATQAGRVLALSGGDAIGAYRHALDASRGYRPAAWALRPLALELGDPLTLGEVYEQLADTAMDRRAGAAQLVRSALLRADADPKAAGAILERARTLVPRDAVLQSLLLRLSGNTSPTGRAKMLVEGALHAPPELARVFRLQAAAAFEEAHDHAAAAAEYRWVLEQQPEDPIASAALDRTEIAADEVARVASRLFAAVKDAASPEDRARALEELALLDLHHRNDAASAVLSFGALLENAPGHLPSLRTLQVYFAEHQRTEDGARVAAAMAEHVEAGPDVTAHARLARRLILADSATSGDAADGLLLATGDRAELDVWLAPRVLAAARAANDTALAKKATLAIASVLGAADERASARLRVAELEEGEARIELLREAVQASPTHPLAAVLLAEACEATADREATAEAWELAGGATGVKIDAAARWHRAGVLWQELGDAGRACAALARASREDVTYADTFERLRGLLEEAGDHEGMAALYAARLSAGGDTPEIIGLYLKQAKLRTEIRDLAGAKAALRAALALSPEHLDGLRALANLSIEDEDWRGAAEVLIRIARIRKEREELRWVFFTLGDIYDQHMPDPRRAEAAFQRVLKLFPQDLRAMERLAELYGRQGQPRKAAEVLAELAKLEVDPEASRGHRLRLAAIYENAGDARAAESTLEDARRGSPTDLVVVRALADFYQRQNASNAMAMHMRRAVNDFRHALESDLGDASAWPGLVEVLQWSGQPDSAAAAASAAQALGIVDIEMSKLVDPRGGAPGGGQGAASSSLDEVLAPQLLTAPARAVFKAAGDALEQALPFDVAAYRAEKVGARDTTIRPLAAEVGRWFGFGSVELYTTSAAPRVCVPVYSKPVTLLIGSELLGITDDREKVFILTRAFKIAKAQLSVVVRAQPIEVLALMAGLVQSYDPHYTPVGVDAAHAEEAARRIARSVQRKVRDELGPLVFEMSGRPGYAPGQLAMAASEWGNRIGLLASGSAPAAVSALAKLSGERALPADTAGRLAMVQRFPEAAALLTFAISDAHFDARKRALKG